MLLNTWGRFCKPLKYKIYLKETKKSPFPIPIVIVIPIPIPIPLIIVVFILSPSLLSLSPSLSPSPLSLSSSFCPCPPHPCPSCPYCLVVVSLIWCGSQGGHCVVVMVWSPILSLCPSLSSSSLLSHCPHPMSRGSWQWGGVRATLQSSSILRFLQGGSKVY